jgi:hypothetical protein
MDALIQEASLRFNVPEKWIRAVMRQESGGRVHIVSKKGAMGLMQLMPGTWALMRDAYKLGNDPYNPHDNVMAGTAYLREMYDLYGSPGFLAAYNAGPGRYETHLRTQRPLPAETQHYVAVIYPQIAGINPDGPSPAKAMMALAAHGGGVVAVAALPAPAPAATHAPAQSFQSAQPFQTAAAPTFQAAPAAPVLTFTAAPAPVAKPVMMAALEPTPAAPTPTPVHVAVAQPTPVHVAAVAPTPVRFAAATPTPVRFAMAEPEAATLRPPPLPEARHVHVAAVPSPAPAPHHIMQVAYATAGAPAPKPLPMARHAATATAAHQAPTPAHKTQLAHAAPATTHAAPAAHASQVAEAEIGPNHHTGDHGLVYASHHNHLPPGWFVPVADAR